MRALVTNKRGGLAQQAALKCGPRPTERRNANSLCWLFASGTGIRSARNRSREASWPPPPANPRPRTPAEARKMRVALVADSAAAVLEEFEAPMAPRLFLRSGIMVPDPNPPGARCPWGAPGEGGVGASGRLRGSYGAPGREGD
jgi:hypothetical protein